MKVNLDMEWREHGRKCLPLVTFSPVSDVTLPPFTIMGDIPPFRNSACFETSVTACSSLCVCLFIWFHTQVHFGACDVPMS